MFTSFHSLVGSPNLDSSTDPPPLLWGSTVDPLLHHTNPFNPSQPSPPPLSPSNPFFSLLHNPFYKDMLNSQALNPPLPPLPFLSSARPPITTIFPEANATIVPNTDYCTDLGTTGKAMDEDCALSNKSTNPFIPEKEQDAEWDQSFDEFAAGRLQSPEDLTTDCKTLQNTPCGHSPTHSINKETMLLKTDCEQTTNDRLLHFQPMLNFTCTEPNIQVKDTSTYHFFTKFLDTIPENSLEYDNKLFGASPQAPKPNTDIFNDSNSEQLFCEISCQKPNSSSPDPTSSGLGSSAEEDVLSCLSSYSVSDKLSASSSEETEAQNFESNILGFEKSPVKRLKTSESEEESTDKSDDLSLDVDQRTVIEVFGREVVSSSSAPDLVRRDGAAGTETEGRDTDESNRYDDPNPQLDMGVSPTPENELSPTLPPFCVITSSPRLPDSLSDSPFENTNVAEQDHLSLAPVALFNDFLNTSSIRPSPDVSLMHTNASDRSSFQQSLDVSADSEEYQTCLTHTTKLSDTLHSANSTLCMELNSVQMANDTASGLDDFFNTNRPSNEEIVPTGLNGALFGDVSGANFESSFTAVNDFSLKSNFSSHPKQEVFVDDLFSKRLETEYTTLHRSQSEGTLTPGFDDLHPSAFGSDPGTIQESASSQPEPDLLLFTPFAPSLIPQSSSSPLALCPFPPVADAATGSPTCPPPALAQPQSKETQQQQAANQHDR